MKHLILSFINTLGRFVIGFFRASGDLILFTLQTILHMFKLPFYIHEMIRMSILITAEYRVGNLSIFVAEHRTIKMACT